VWPIPLDCEQRLIAVRRNTGVCCGDDPRWRIIQTGQLVKWYVAGPVMFAIGARNRQSAVTGSPNRYTPYGLISNVPIHVGINNVLRRRRMLRKCVPELLPVLRCIHIEEWDPNVLIVVDDPLQSDLSTLTGQKIGNDRAMAGDE